MASENTRNEEEPRPGPGLESNEHDYAHTAHGPPPEQSSGLNPESEPQLAPVRIIAPVSRDPSEPVVGADCLGGAEETLTGGPSSPSGTRRGPRRFRRPEDQSCSCCHLQFQRQGRSFNRRSVYTFTSPDTVRWVFPDSAVNDRSFLCETCAQIIRSRGRRRQTGKRCLWLKPPPARKGKDSPASGQRMGKKSRAALLVSKSSYRAAFQTLWSSKGARRPMIEFWSKQLKTEMKALSRTPDSPFHQKVSGRKPLSSFPWRRCLNWAQDKAPLVIACLRSMFPDLNALYKSSNQLTEDQAITLLERRAVVALSIPLFTRNIWRNNFLQAALGAELRLQGCSGSALDTLNTMGLCQNKDTVRLLLHRLQNGKDMEGDMMMKREQIKEQMGEVMTEEEDDENEEEEEDVEEIVMGMKEEEPVEQEEVQDVLEEEVEDPAVTQEKRRKKKAKKQRKEEKRKERGKRKAREEQDDEEGQQKKRKVVVVRLGLLKGTSEVGRADLSAP